MLSKLQHFSSEQNIRLIKNSYIESDLVNEFGSAITSIKAVSNGTSGHTFFGYLNGHKRYFKTYGFQSKDLTLIKEAYFLDLIEGEKADVKIIDIFDGRKSRKWIHMNAFEKSKGLSPEEVRELVSSYESIIRLNKYIVTVNEKDSILILIEKANDALLFLHRRKLISPNIFDLIKNKIKILHAESKDWEFQISHGDLGPENIMFYKSSPVVIDWEDAFWGVPGFDYLYWLTFYENRKWLSKDILGYTSLSAKTEIAVMSIILVLKSYLSVLNNNFTNNYLNFNQRISEVIELE